MRIITIIILALLIISCTKVRPDQGLVGEQPTLKVQAPEKLEYNFITLSANAPEYTLNIRSVLIDNNTLTDQEKINLPTEQYLLGLAKLTPGRHKLTIILESLNSEQKTIMPGKIITTTFNSKHNSALNLKIAIDESIFTSEEGQTIFAPVIYVKQITGYITTKSDKTILIDNPEEKTLEKIGMDIDGNTGVGKNIPSSSRISTQDGPRIIPTEIPRPAMLFNETIDIPADREYNLMLYNDNIMPKQIAARAGEKVQLNITAKDKSYLFSVGNESELILEGATKIMILTPTNASEIPMKLGESIIGLFSVKKP